MNDEYVTQVINALTRNPIADVEHVTDEPHSYFVITFNDDTEFCFVPMASLTTTPHPVPTKDTIRRYLANQHCVLWGRNFDIISNPDEATDWLHKIITDIWAITK